MSAWYALRVGEIVENSNNKSRITVSRNTPAALIVGAAGFLGSHLSGRLLKNNIQVIGVDNFSTGQKDYLSEVIKDKAFHLLSQGAQNLDIDVDRIDYIYIVANDNWSIRSVLEIAKKYHSKVVFVSTASLYDSRESSDFNWYKNTEVELAQFAKSQHLNVRVVRLVEVYGPKMHFRNNDIMSRLIQATLGDRLQKEAITTDFSSRALYIEDAINLIIKSMMAGSTALKIFDGCLPSPIKVEEIKQVLLDPIWHEARRFKPSELPPWPTPNLDQTMKYLSWQPKADLVKSLRETIAYFKENEDFLSSPSSPKPLNDWQEKLAIWKEELGGHQQKEQLKESGINNKPKQPLEEKPHHSKRFSRPSFGSIVAVLVVFFAIFYPVIALTWGVITYRSNLNIAAEALSKGDFNKSLSSVRAAQMGVGKAKEFVEALEIFKKAGMPSGGIEQLEEAVRVGEEIAKSSEHAVLGTKAIYDSLKTISGERSDPPKDYVAAAQRELQAADSGFSKASVILADENFGRGVPFMEDRIKDLKDKVSTYTSLIKRARATTFLLPELIGLEGKKSYLMLLQNNNELRPTGGFIGSLARIDFENGKLKNLDVQDVYNVDGQLNFHVEPPKEIREDLGQNDWNLRDSNWEPDFPTAARQAAWFYTQITGIRLDGVIALDVSSMESMLNVIGPLALSDYNETITSANLFERSITHAEQGFFPGSQAKKNFLTALSLQLFNKIFYTPNQDWPGILNALTRSFAEKHVMVYLADPKLFSYLVSENFAGSLPRQPETKPGELVDFLAVVEANVGANKANYYLDRNFNLESTIGKEGEVSHRLRINYTNRSSSDVWPAGKYKNRLRVYLPFGTRVARALWGEKEITSSLSGFVDYGRSGYSLLLELGSKESKTLVLDYTLSTKLAFKEKQATYHLDVIKQAGTIKDPFEWKLFYPINFRVSLENSTQVGPQEHNISTDLSGDRRFEVVFTK
jgi:nucleoside-diphosphate-sugar epimerase